jgi:hypothetical protein
MLKKKVSMYNMYKTYASLLGYALRIAERNYHKNRFVSCKNNSKKTWKHINQLLGRNVTKCNNDFVIEGIAVDDCNQIARAFAKYFDEIPRITQNNVGITDLNLLSLIPINNNSLFLLPSTSDEDVGKLKNSNDLLDILTLLIKIAVQQLSIVISDLYNLCILEGTYPDLFKIARIVPVFKKGDKSIVNNYRPISILPVLNKIFEKLTLTRLSTFISANELLSKNQHGFHPGYSTDTAMLDLMRNILPAFSRKLFAICIFLDFSKAFDTVEHSLLNKLERYGLRSKCLEFFGSYLNNRFMYVNYNGSMSERYPVKLSVPQGSCLGPILYNLYTNDLNYYLDDVAKVVYADDTNLIVVSDDFDDIISAVTDTMVRLHDWCKFNKLCLNADKTKYMIISPLSVPYEPVIKINGNQLERVTSIKYLGVTFDDKLKFHEQTNSLNNKLSRFCGITYRLAQFYTLDIAKTFYYSFVYPTITYGILIWGGCLVETCRLTRTQAYQNRIITNLFRNFYPTLTLNEILKQIQLITIKDIYNVKCAEFMYKIMILNKFPDLKHFLLSACIENTHETRHSHNLRPIFPRIDVIRLSFWYRFIIIWNNVPQDVKVARNIGDFKYRLKTYLIGLY